MPSHGGPHKGRLIVIFAVIACYLPSNQQNDLVVTMIKFKLDQFSLYLHGKLF